jgi:hypothetical protein
MGFIYSPAHQPTHHRNLGNKGNNSSHRDIGNLGNQGFMVTITTMASLVAKSCYRMSSWNCQLFLQPLFLCRISHTILINGEIYS